MTLQLWKGSSPPDYKKWIENMIGTIRVKGKKHVGVLRGSLQLYITNHKHYWLLPMKQTKPNRGRYMKTRWDIDFYNLRQPGPVAVQIALKRVEVAQRSEADEGQHCPLQISSRNRASDDSTTDSARLPPSTSALRTEPAEQALRTADHTGNRRVWCSASSSIHTDPSRRSTRRFFL